ncbi:MAG: hypothetical protein ACREN6_02240 [Gemmatimonadaceae bacterium]
MRRDTSSSPDAWTRINAAAWPLQGRRIERFLLADGIKDITIPAAEISIELASALVKGSGRTFAELAQAAEDTKHGIGVIPLKVARASLATAVERHVTPGRNILAMIEGSDGSLASVIRLEGQSDLTAFARPRHPRLCALSHRSP